MGRCKGVEIKRKILRYLRNPNMKESDYVSVEEIKHEFRGSRHRDPPVYLSVGLSSLIFTSVNSCIINTHHIKIQTYHTKREVEANIKNTVLKITKNLKKWNCRRRIHVKNNFFHLMHFNFFPFTCFTSSHILLLSIYWLLIEQHNNTSDNKPN